LAAAIPVVLSLVLGFVAFVVGLTIATSMVLATALPTPVAVAIVASSSLAVAVAVAWFVFRVAIPFVLYLIQAALSK